MKATQKCNLQILEFCAPMLQHSMGKFADGTLQIVSKIDPESGRERFANEIVFSHTGPVWPGYQEPRQGVLARFFGHVSLTGKRTPRPLRLNFCPWCGAGLTEPGTGEA